jgi:hypothetical protein
MTGLSFICKRVGLKRKANTFNTVFVPSILLSQYAGMEYGHARV